MKHKKYLISGLSAIIFAATVWFAWAQIATSCVPNPSQPWCFDGANIKPVDGTSSVLFSDGTAAAPGIAFSNEPGLGLRRRAPGLMEFMESGVIRVTFGPGFKLTLGGDVNLHRDAANALALRNDTAAQTFFIGATNAQGSVRLGSVLQANLGTPADGTITYCSDCTIANPCAGSGTGAIAKRLNSVWVCN